MCLTGYTISTQNIHTQLAMAPRFPFPFGFPKVLFLCWRLMIRVKESEEGKKNFCVVSNKIIEIDYLYLKSSGHERIAFDISSGKFNWLAP